ncbi:MAG TPA: Uma2 family endonuclease, partial [Vicinamibacterales bacterium]|nr:Uma2 family endonuclease [Vicinamibacterales bacterium]
EWVPTADQRVVTYGVPWAHYEAQLALRGERASPRIAYLEGAMELMSRSKDHERIKAFIGRLIETYALERGIDLSPYGAWTLKAAPRQSGREPDECYLVGDQTRDIPDLAIEVVWTSGGIDKLEIYRRLGVGEVWVWKESVITVHVLRENRYEHTAQSALFPDLDVNLLAGFLQQPTVLQAVTAFREALRR